MIPSHRTSIRSGPAPWQRRVRAMMALMAFAALTALAESAGAVPPIAPLARTPGFYAGLQAGTNDLRHWPATVGFAAGARAHGGLSPDPAASFGLAVGRRTENARFEFEYQRGRFHLRGTNLGAVSVSASGAGQAETVLFRADRVLPIADTLTAYAGGGLGWGSVTLPHAGSAGGCPCFGAPTGQGLAYQGRVGFEYSFTNGPNVFVQASWISLPGASSGGTPGVEYPRRGTAALDAGLRLRF